MDCSVRKPEDAAYLQQLLGADFSPLIMDITDAAAVAAAADHVRASLNGQPLTALVNNAGVPFCAQACFSATSSNLKLSCMALS